jgi:hypothetical protein
MWAATQKKRAVDWGLAGFVREVACPGQLTPGVRLHSDIDNRFEQTAPIQAGRNGDKDMLNDETLQQALRHALWIGGAPDAGKTSVAAVLVEKYGLQFYSLDEHAEEHWFDHVSKDPSAFGHTWMSRSLDERWLQAPEQQHGTCCASRKMIFR